METKKYVVQNETTGMFFAPGGTMTTSINEAAEFSTLEAANSFMAFKKISSGLKLDGSNNKAKLSVFVKPEVLEKAKV